MAEMDMRQVVQRLRAENSEALLELVEFDNVFDEFLGFLERLAELSEEMGREVQSVVPLIDDEQSTGELQERARALGVGVANAIFGFRQIRRAMKTWEITPAPERPSGAQLRGSSSGNDE